MKSHHRNHHRKHIKYYEKRLAVVLVLSLVLLPFTGFLRSAIPSLAVLKPIASPVMILLTVVIYAYGGWPFIKGMVSEVRMRRLGMMTLVSLGITSATLYSLLEFLGGREPSASSEVSFLVLVMLTGHWAEMKYAARASRALEELASLLPPHAHLIVDGEVKDVPLEKLKPGDKTLVKPGERIPADGVVVKGRANVDESLLTGEAKPVLKEPGSEVIGGSLNMDGALVVEVKKTGKETFLHQVICLVRQAQESRTRIQTLADKGAMVLTYVAVAIAVISLAYWITYDMGFAVERMVAVLVAACPHALGIGVPLSAIVTSLRGALKGILIRNRKAFEQAAKVDAVLFDKTGTLTKGELRVVEVRVLDDKFSEEEVLRYAASVERVSEHPIAKAIVDYAESQGVKLEEVSKFEVIAGVGIRGSVASREVYVGGPALLQELGYPAPATSETSGVGVYVIVDNKPVGEIILRDTLREEAFEAIHQLRRMGVKVLMLTGDRRSEAERVAKSLGLDAFYAELRPEDKVRMVEKLQAEGHIVAMVGDGINDAPALAKANVGVAIGAGTQVAIESADVVLVRNDPRDLVTVLSLSREMQEKMKANVGWTILYNVCVMIAASGALASIGLVLTPTIGASLMALSDIVAITISIR